MSKKAFGTTSKGVEASLYEISNGSGVSSTFDRLWRFSCIYFCKRTGMAMREMSF